MKAVVAAFNQEKALVGAFSVITNLQMDLFEALVQDVQTWGDCADLCYTEDQCTLWTWIGPDSSLTARWRECILKQGAKPAHVGKSNGLVSAVKCKTGVSETGVYNKPK